MINSSLLELIKEYFIEEVAFKGGAEWSEKQHITA
jgi:hypothetical protein